MFPLLLHLSQVDSILLASKAHIIRRTLFSSFFARRAEVRAWKTREVSICARFWSENGTHTVVCEAVLFWHHPCPVHCSEFLFEGEFLIKSTRIDCIPYVSKNARLLIVFRQCFPAPSHMVNYALPALFADLLSHF